MHAFTTAIKTKYKFMYIKKIICYQLMTLWYIQENIFRKKVSFQYFCSNKIHVVKMAIKWNATL